MELGPPRDIYMDAEEPTYGIFIWRTAPNFDPPIEAYGVTP
jgi:hypothetical protein